MTVEPFVVDRATSPAVTGRRLLALWARPEYAAVAREFATNAVAGHPFDPYEISLVTSDLVTNAILTAAACVPRWPDETYSIGVQIAITARYVHLAVTDSDDGTVSVAGQGVLLDGGGYGMTVVDRYATARWVTYAEHGRTVHAVVPAAGVELTPAELAALGVPAAHRAGAR